MLKKLSLVMAVTLALSACNNTSTPAPKQTENNNVTSQTVEDTNPLLTVSKLPFQAPPFDKIKDAHYMPAFEQGMKEHLAEIDKIKTNPEPANFQNTIDAMERSGETLSRVSEVFFGVLGADTNPERQNIQTEIAPKLAEHQDAIYLDAALFARVESIYNERDKAGLEPVQKRLVELTYDNFVHAGAKLDAAQKETLRKLNIEESSLTTDFQKKLLEATKAGAYVVDTQEALAGLSAGDIDAAAAEAKTRKLDKQFVLPLQNTTQQPASSSLQNRESRAALLKASDTRASKGDANDTQATIKKIAALRIQKAKLLGFKNYAAYSLSDQMAKTPENALKLLTDTVPAATRKAQAEAADIQAVVDSQPHPYPFTAADWNFYSEQVRKQKFDLDEAAIKPYFEMDSVLKNGVFYAATRLYGITFKERTDIPVYHPDVKVYEVFDKDGTSLALFYTDYFKRDSKSGGAWMGNFVNQNALTGTKPVVYNVCNYQKPAQGQPALLSFDDVTTMFHEFGHALHGIFSKVAYPSIAGANTTNDFVEFPSQFNEHWAMEPTVFANYAKHYQTGEKMPDDMVAKLKQSSTFNQGYATTEYLSAALLDMAWHSIEDENTIGDVAQFEQQALATYKVNLSQVPPRYRTPYFSHIWGGGYSARYYAYFWAEVLDHDAYEWFVENGGLTEENGQTFRDKILSRGNSEPHEQLYRDVRGKDPIDEGLIKYRGLK